MKSGNAHGRLVLPAELRAQLLARARAAGPREACGLLLGRARRVRELCEVRNLAAEPAQTFELDPGAVVAGEDRARALGLAVIGVWHSHPEGEALPSRADRAGAWPGWEQVIVAPRAARGANLRAWHLHAGNASELELDP